MRNADLRSRDCADLTKSLQAAFAALSAVAALGSKIPRQSISANSLRYALRVPAMVFVKSVQSIYVEREFRKCLSKNIQIMGELYAPQGEKRMWTADNWKDYEVLDASAGEKLERWGDYLLIRPDPQVIWNTDKTHPGWKKRNAHYHRSSKGGGEWEFFDLPDEWSIHYKALTFNLKPFSFKHTGLFPEQAANWDWFSSLIKDAVKGSGRQIKVLNLFAYTGGATVAAAKAGASVTHVDSSKGMVTWAKENAAASGLASAPIRWLVDDCVKFVEREIRRGNTYDAIIMDPPSYGRGPKGDILSKDALFFLINSYTTGLQPAVLSYMVKTVITPRFGGHAQADEIGLPVSSNGLILPCGAACRWQNR